MNKMISTLILTIIFGVMYYIFSPKFPDVIFVTIGVFIVLVIKELIVSYFNNKKNTNK